MFLNEEYEIYAFSDSKRPTITRLMYLDFPTFFQQIMNHISEVTLQNNVRNACNTREDSGLTWQMYNHNMRAMQKVQRILEMYSFYAQSEISFFLSYTF